MVNLDGRLELVDRACVDDLLWWSGIVLLHCSEARGGLRSGWVGKEAVRVRGFCAGRGSRGVRRW